MTDSVTVDVNTDDLDDFSKLMSGQATPTTVEAPAGDEVETEDEASETPSATEEVEESATPEEGDDGVDTPADDEDDEPEKKPQGRKSARERINELTAKARDAERRADALAKELEAAKSQKTDEPVRQEVKTALDPTAPDPDATLEDGSLKYPLGEFDKTYIADLTRHTIRLENETFKKEAEVERQNEAMQRQEQELFDAWSVKLTEASERLPDFKEKVVELEETFVDLDPNYGKYLASTIMSLEFGPEVLDYLADHPDEARIIVAAGPTRATVALGRLEARFASSGNEVEKGKVTTTKAPAPPPTNKGSHGKTSVSADTDDLDAFSKQFFAKK